MSGSKLLTGKVVLISGCNRGIGKEITNTFIANGAIVYANARKEGSLDQLIEELPIDCRSQIIPVYFDVNDHESIKQVFIKIKECAMSTNNPTVIAIVIVAVLIALAVMTPGAIATVVALRKRTKMTLHDPELEHRFATFIRN